MREAEKLVAVHHELIATSDGKGRRYRARLVCVLLCSMRVQGRGSETWSGQRHGIVCLHAPPTYILPAHRSSRVSSATNVFIQVALLVLEVLSICARGIMHSAPFPCGEQTRGWCLVSTGCNGVRIVV